MELRTGSERAAPIEIICRMTWGWRKGVVISMRSKTIVVEVDA